MLLTVDESTYEEDDGNTTDDDHPISWCQRYEGGRSWYTGMGHTQATFSEAPFLAHLLSGLEIAAGVQADADCGKQAGGNRPPVVEAVRTPAGDVSLGDPIEFKATATDPDGDTLTYEWDFGDGAKANTATAIHAYTTPGVWYAKVTVTDGKGGKTEKLLQVAVQPEQRQRGDGRRRRLGARHHGAQHHRLREPRRVRPGRRPRLHGEPVRHRHLDRRGGRADGLRQEHDGHGPPRQRLRRAGLRRCR